MKTASQSTNFIPGNAPWIKRPVAANELASLISITSTYIRGNRMRMSLRSALRTKHDLSVLDSKVPVFYRQWLGGTSCVLAAKEFCMLAADPDKSVIRLQIEINPALSVSLTDWSVLLRYCIACRQLTDAPALVLNSPQHTHSVDLFILCDTPFQWEVVKPEHQKTIYQMMSLRLALWLTQPMYRRMPLQSWNPTDKSNSSQYSAFVSWAIDRLLTEQKPETIHQLADQLRIQYQIESDYQTIDHSFSKLRFRYANLTWLSTTQLKLGVDDIRIWLAFHRLTKRHTIGQRILELPLFLCS